MGRLDRFMTFIQRGQLESILESCRRRAGAHLDLITARETSHHAARKAQSSPQKSFSEKGVIYVRAPGLDSGLRPNRHHNLTALVRHRHA
jgi:hypothetical protein